MRFKKKPEEPVYVEAMQFDGTFTGMMKLKENFPTLRQVRAFYNQQNDTVTSWTIDTFHGEANVHKDDWIIENGDGSFSLVTDFGFVSNYVLA